MIMNQNQYELVSVQEKPQDIHVRKEEPLKDITCGITSVPAVKCLSVKTNEDNVRGVSEVREELECPILGLKVENEELECPTREVVRNLVRCDDESYNEVEKRVDEDPDYETGDEENDEEVEARDFSKAEWSNHLEQEWIPEDSGPQALSNSASSRSGSEWTEGGESEYMEYYESTRTGCFNTVAKVLQKYREDQDQFIFMSSVVPRNNEQELSEEDFLLPPRNPNDVRKTLVLDLDETLVHCFLEYEENAAYDWTFQVDGEDALFDVFCRVRPYLEEFLKECAKMFELVLFTASQDNYANKVLDLVDPAGYIQYRLFRRHCTKVRGNFVKDLSLLGRELSQTIIIDNSPLAFAFQPSNGIPCDNWFDDQMDEEFSHLLQILRHLKTAEDVRDELSEIFKIGWFLEGLRYSLALAEECDWMCVEAC